jgi:hypothetical protein
VSGVEEISFLLESQNAPTGYRVSRPEGARGVVVEYPGWSDVPVSLQALDLQSGDPTSDREYVPTGPLYECWEILRREAYEPVVEMSLRSGEQRLVVPFPRGLWSLFNR